MFGISTTHMIFKDSEASACCGWIYNSVALGIYGIVIRPVFGTIAPHMHSQWARIEFLKYCGCLCTALGICMVVLYNTNIYLALAPQTFTQDSHTCHEVSEVL